MRNLVVLGAAALTLALGVAQASAVGQDAHHGPAYLEFTAPSANANSTQPDARRFEAHESDATQTLIDRHTRR